MEKEQSLSGVTVLDFSRVLAGPLTTMLLADLGADVIKVESPLGDETRAWGPPWIDVDGDRQSAYFFCVNRNKKSCVLDLKTEKGQGVARNLARRSQVLVENFKPGEMKRFSLDYASLRPQNPSLVYCSISGFGQTGPDRDRPGYDFVVQAISGLMSITGPRDGPSCKVGVAISDVIAGLFAAVGILSALRHAEKTRQGQFLDISLLDCQIASLVNVASNFLASRRPPHRLGNEHPNIVPYQTFEALDGEFALAVGNDRQFRRLCDVLDHPLLHEDARFATNPARVENREELLPVLQAIFHQRRVSDWMTLLRERKIPCGAIHDVPTALEDAQVRARGLVEEFLAASGETLRMIGSPIRMNATPPDVRTLPPHLGQHTDEVLASLESNS